jgi:apolipoprotein N-acyltransferase
MMEQDHEAIVRNDIAAGLGIGLIVGTVLRRPLPEGSARALTRFNTALLIDEQGSVRGRYDKQLLLPFGEMLPLGDTFPVLHELSPNTGTFSPGTSQQALLLGAHRLSVSICYEDIMPGLFNDMVRASDPHLLVNLTNDGWFGNTAEPWIHLTLARVRSIEHRRYLARATSTGYSAIVDPFGRLVAHGTTFEQEVIVGKVRMLEGSTPYRWLGNKPWWLLTALLVAAGFVRHPSTPGRSKLAGAE